VSNARLATATKTARLTALRDLLNAGTLTLYGGTPLDPDVEVTTETPLLSYDLAATSGTVDGATLTVTTPDPSAGLANGSATWGRFATTDGDPVLDGDCGIFGSDKLIILDSLTVAENVVITVLSISFEE
jgi:hypothetical protein